MEPHKHRTPSGLPPANFDEPQEVWKFVSKPANELELIIGVGVWAPPEQRRLRKARARSKPGEPLFCERQGVITAWSTICWWEKRRLAFNAILLAAMIPVLLALWTITMAFRYKMVDLPDAFSHADRLFDPPILIYLLVGANICFTLAWLAELAAATLLRSRSPQNSPALLAACLWLSLLAIGFVSIGMLHFAIGR